MTSSDVGLGFWGCNSPRITLRNWEGNATEVSSRSKKPSVYYNLIGEMVGICQHGCEYVTLRIRTLSGFGRK